MLIVGAGVLGLATALELAGRRHSVRVVDPGEPNASSVAAGMIAPALESAVENATPERAALLRAARDLWPAFADRFGLTLHRRPTEWRGEPATMRARLDALGFATRLGAAGQLITDEDFQIDAEAAMGRMAGRLGEKMIRARVCRMEPGPGAWRVWIESAASSGYEVVSARHVILATGAAGPVPGLPEAVGTQIAAIRPIRGQIGRIPVDCAPDAVLRGPLGYAAPTPDGVLIGATMDADRRDLTPDSASSARLEAAAQALLRQAPKGAHWRVGVRGATADGLPLVGASGAPGLALALAPRRNGWLLAPLVARIAADAVEGRAPGEWAAAMDPGRHG